MVNLSAREIAKNFLALKTNTSKAAVTLIEDARSRCTGKNASKKARWERLVAAMEANDRHAVLRYSDYTAWTKAEAAKTKAKPSKAKAKPAAKAKAKPAAKAAEPSVAEVAKSFGVDPDLMAAFVEMAKSGKS
jgi:uncharacterized membrane protein